MRIIITSRRLRRHIRRFRSLARDGARLSALGLLVMLVLAHPGPQLRAAIFLGLAGIACTALSRPQGARRTIGGSGARTVDPRPAQRLPGPLSTNLDRQKRAQDARFRRNGWLPPLGGEEDDEPPF